MLGTKMYQDEEMADDQWSTLAWKESQSACSLAGSLLGVGGCPEEEDIVPFVKALTV